MVTSPRFDFQLGAKTRSASVTCSIAKQTSSGVSQFAFNAGLQRFQSRKHLASERHGDPTIQPDHETRFQYLRADNNQVSENATPTISVQGAFTGGGNNQGTVRDTQDRYESQDYVTGAFGKHSLNFGTRLRLTHDNNESTSGYNGNYVYNSLAVYAAGTPSQYQVTGGNPSATVNLFDASLFFQDDWRLRPNLTLSYGLRYEGQNRIHDLSDWAPRFLLAYAPTALSKAAGKTVFRLGYGWFFDRFSSTYVLDAIHGNGINQQQYVVDNPDFVSNAPSAATLAASSSVAPSIYQVGPALKAAVNMQTALGVDHQFGKVATVSATYTNSAAFINT